METLPAELHSLVVELACASPAGGKTPLALSRANSYFHEIAAPFLFYTIVVTSQEQAEQLLLILESTPEHRRRIERLLLAPGVSARAVLRLIHLAAPTLRALAVLTPPTASALLSAIFRTPFPHLTSLSVRGLYPLPRPGAFPVLERLHLAGNRSPAGLLTALRHACPALTDLRVSSLRGAPAFAREVQAAFLAPSVSVLPPKIRSLVVEGTIPPSNCHEASKRIDDEMRDILMVLPSLVKGRSAIHVEFWERGEIEVEQMKDWLHLASL